MEPFGYRRFAKMNPWLFRLSTTDINGCPHKIRLKPISLSPHLRLQVLLSQLAGYFHSNNSPNKARRQQPPALLAALFPLHNLFSRSLPVIIKLNVPPKNYSLHLAVALTARPIMSRVSVYSCICVFVRLQKSTENMRSEHDFNYFGHNIRRCI